MNIAIIVINYNNFDDTVDCIRSIYNTKTSNNIRLNVFVIDNASVDGSDEKLKQLANITLLSSKCNGGFSYANNIGIKAALEMGADYFMFLNNDTVIEENFFEIIMPQLEKDKVVVPLIRYYASNDIWYAGGYIDYRRGTAIHYNDLESNHPIDFMSGCCCILSKEIIEKVGLWDESYFLYCEDIDYSLRLKQQQIKIELAEDAIVYHKVSASTGRDSAFMTYYINRNRLFVIKKFRLGLIPLSYTLITRSIKYLISFFEKNNDYIIGKALIDFIRNKKGNTYQ